MCFVSSFKGSEMKDYGMAVRFIADTINYRAWGTRIQFLLSGAEALNEYLQTKTVTIEY